MYIYIYIYIFFFFFFFWGGGGVFTSFWLVGVVILGVANESKHVVFEGISGIVAEQGLFIGCFFFN